MKSLIRFNLAALIVLLVSAIVALSSCGGIGGTGVTSGGSGGATVQGRVTQFNGVVAFIDPNRSLSYPKRMLASVSDFLVRPSWAGVAGVQVNIAGQITTTDANGSFAVNGIPSGTVTMLLSFAGSMASIPIDIPANATLVTLNDIQVTNNSISVKEIEIETEDENSGDPTSGDQNSQNSEDNPSTEDPPESGSEDETSESSESGS